MLGCVCDTHTHTLSCVRGMSVCYTQPRAKFPTNCSELDGAFRHQQPSLDGEELLPFCSEVGGIYPP